MLKKAVTAEKHTAKKNIANASTLALAVVKTVNALAVKIARFLIKKVDLTNRKKPSSSELQSLSSNDHLLSMFDDLYSTMLISYYLSRLLLIYDLNKLRSRRLVSLPVRVRQRLLRTQPRLPHQRLPHPHLHPHPLRVSHLQRQWHFLWRLQSHLPDDRTQLLLSLSYYSVLSSDRRNCSLQFRDTNFSTSSFE